MAQLLFTLPEASSLLGVTPKTIKTWWRVGKITLTELPGGHYRVPISEIERIVGTKAEPPAAVSCAL